MQVKRLTVGAAVLVYLVVVGLATLGAAADAGKVMPSEWPRGVGMSFGYSVALDGETVLIGAPWSGNYADQTGAAYTYSLGDDSPNALEPGDLSTRDGFGFAVAVEDETAVVTAWSQDANGRNSGSVYSYVRESSGWRLEGKVTPSEAGFRDRFGTSVALGGGTLAVGALGVENSGSVYVFMREQGAWTEEAVLLPESREPGDFFGDSVAVSGDSILAGAPNAADGGVVHVFTRTEGAWGTTGVLSPTDGSEGDHFGDSVAVDDGTAVIGAPDAAGGGAAYVFSEGDGTWIEQSRLMPSTVAWADGFGHSVSVDAETIVVGAPSAGSSDEGAAYVYGLVDGQWTELDRLVAFDGATGELFGFSVDVHERSVAVGAYRARNPEGVFAGAVYLFELPLWCNGLAVTLVGDNADNELRGSSAAEVIWAGDGDDRVNGLGGDDVICLGEGDDWARGGLGDDVIYGGPGGDTLYGTGGRNSIYAGSGDDSVFGGAESDTLAGGAGADTVRGNGGEDLVMGGSGADLLIGGAGDDELLGESGDDVLRGGAGDDALDGGDGDDELYGGPGADTCVAGETLHWC